MNELVYWHCWSASLKRRGCCTFGWSCMDTWLISFRALLFWSVLWDTMQSKPEYLPAGGVLFFFGGPFPRARTLRYLSASLWQRGEWQCRAHHLRCNVLFPVLRWLVNTLHFEVLELFEQLVQAGSPGGVVFHQGGATQPLAQDLIAHADTIGVVRRREDLTLGLRRS